MEIPADDPALEPEVDLSPVKFPAPGKTFDKTSGRGLQGACGA